MSQPEYALVNSNAEESTPEIDAELGIVLDLTVSPSPATAGAYHI